MTQKQQEIGKVFENIANAIIDGAIWFFTPAWESKEKQSIRLLKMVLMEQRARLDDLYKILTPSQRIEINKLKE